MSHANARFDSRGRLLLVQRVAAGEPQAEATRQVRLSRGTMAKWWGRWVEHGDTGLVDRSSRPRRRTDAGTEERICRLRRSTKRSPVYLSARSGVLASTVWRVLRHHGLEFLYARRFRSETDRRIRLKRWICDCNCHRHHTAVGGPPASRANYLTRTDS